MSAPFRHVVSVCEATRSAGERAREILEALGCTVTPENTPDQVARRCAGNVPPDVVFVAFPDGAPVVETVKSRTGTRPVVVAALPAPADEAAATCAEVGADLFVVRPHGSEGLAAALRAATALAAERARVTSLEASEAMLRERLSRYGQADEETGFQHFDFFKELLLRELKRAKRYDYPLAVCLVALDPWQDRAPPQQVARVMRKRVAQAISACIRDIDLPVDLEEDRFLVFLPYTDLDGGENVGKRVAAAVRDSGEVTVAGESFGPSVSVGVAATRPGKPISFARLMRESSAAVRASQLKGGGRVVVRS